MASSFQQRMKMRKKEATQGMAQVMRRSLIIVGGEVALATPVKTGFMRSNWQAGLIPVTNTRNPYSRSFTYGPERAEVVGPNYRGAVAQHALIAATYMDATAPLFLVNATPYLSQVNYGTVKQTGVGFFERAIDRSLRRGFIQEKIFFKQGVTINRRTR